MGKLERKIAPPRMSWEEPIEEEILSFVRYMKQRWQTQVHGNIWRSINKAAQNYVSVYETVEKHIVSEMKFRESIKTKQNLSEVDDAS